MASLAAWRKQLPTSAGLPTQAVVEEPQPAAAAEKQAAKEVEQLREHVAALTEQLQQLQASHTALLGQVHSGALQLSNMGEAVSRIQVDLPAVGVVLFVGDLLLQLSLVSNSKVGKSAALLAS